MSKKHFVALAAVLKTVKEEHNQSPAGDSMWLASVNAVALVCAMNNARFDRARFLEACGVES